MKSIKTLLLTLTLFASLSTFAQKLSKIAHINVQELMAQMPEVQQAQAELKKLEQTYAADIQDSQKMLQAKSKELQDKVKGLSNEEIEARHEEFDKLFKEIQNMETNIAGFRKTAMEELQQKSEEKMAPLIKKVQDAIEKVATAQGIDYVMDSSLGVLLVANGKDLIEDVKKELNIKAEASAKP